MYNSDPQLQRVMVNLAYLLQQYSDVTLDTYKGIVHYNGTNYSWTVLDSPSLTAAVATYNATIDADNIASQTMLNFYMAELEKYKVL